MHLLLKNLGIDSTKKEEIKAEYDTYKKNKEILASDSSKKKEDYPTIFFKDSELTDGGKEKDIGPKPIDPKLIEYLHKCFEDKWGDDLTPFREDLEKRENIAKFISDAGGDLEMNYDEAIKEEWKEIRDKYLPDLHLFDDI